ncbi:MAG: hypothetical protein AB7Q42_14650 [Acidimicrobiia bacterium]
MSELTRRSFLAGSAGAATGAILLAGARTASATDSEPAVTGLRPRSYGGGGDTSTDGVVVYVRDAAAGNVLVMAGEESIEVTDPKLVKAVARALRNGEG